MKSILLSLPPKRLLKILNGKQTVIIRKTMPKCALPIDVYVYCTKNGHFVQEEMESVDDTGWCDFPTGIYATLSKEDKKRHGKPLNAKVIAKFTLREVEDLRGINSSDGFSMLERACLDYDEFIDYLYKGKEGAYTWHLTGLQIFDKPKELSDLRYWGCLDKVKQAPRTFTYVEGLE